MPKSADINAAEVAAATGLRAEFCEAWMVENGVRSLADLRLRYPTRSHPEVICNAVKEITGHALG